ncbi:MAG TPA: LysR family transcriptional regulator [Candidatus Acidoferrales bacterium]|nr:LysR family transcriptional regulator [Candidatus Acidoferrales bacterium]
MAASLRLDRTVTLNQLRTFSMVAEQLSFSVAAQELGLSQPSVSYQVKELETAVGTPLLDRMGKHVTLTEAGHVLHDYTRRTLNLLDEAALALERLRGMERGSLRVGASTTVGIYVIPSVLGAFKKLHPELAVSLQIGNRQQMHDQVLRAAIDLAVYSDPGLDPELSVDPFMDDELVLVVPAGHPLADRKKLALGDLAGESYLTREAGSGTREAFEALARSVGVDLAVAMELGSNSAIKQAVKGGLGVAVISRHALTLELARGDLVELDVAGFPIRRSWSIVHLRRRLLPFAVEGFIEYLRGGAWRTSP